MVKMSLLHLRVLAIVVIQAQQVHKDRLDHLEQWVILVHKDQVVSMEIQVHKDHQDQKVRRDHKDYQVLQDQ
jgi:hypothetical protein